MKEINVLLFTMILLLTVCTSQEKNYEKAIADYVQTDRHGTWADLNFKALSLESSERMVADNLQLTVAVRI